MDMEVAGQWRRQWAGTAEYGKVVEGGVTRRVARAMEVLHASAPGTKVRVMRAAYHSTAGPGAPTSSYLMHSSRQVLSSGSHFLDPPSLPTKPLEISSTPLESSPDSEAERENYKVTEPDDYDISEPSKWKGSSSKSSLRMPSEESSSTDNASIVDLDPKSSSTNSLRRSFRRNNENFLAGHKHNSTVSPLLDAPVALSTLKYTSLLNGSEDWNNRRKSYSFEDAAPSQPLLNKSISKQNDKLKIDSSTDSGICKSSEIVDDQKNVNYLEKSSFDRVSNTFQDWLCKNRPYKVKPIKLVQPSDNNVSNITLKSTGKMTITLPITIEDDKISERTVDSYEENERKIKRVEFCKTELHFAAETGTVNIIATDAKPPPSNDFRKKRSAFVPLNDRFEKSVTLFRDKIEQPSLIAEEINLRVRNDENTAATKSILKNKIPKPKPYLLGENMVLGNIDHSPSNDSDNYSNPTTVSLINRQLQSGRYCKNESSFASDKNVEVTTHEVFRTTNKDLHSDNDNNIEKQKNEATHVTAPIRKIKEAVSPLHGKITSRQLRDTDLAYFGIYDKKESNGMDHFGQDNLQEEIFHSVKLVQRVSNSVSNSEVDSDDAPEYENLTTSKVIPTPKPRSKYKKDIHIESRILKPIPESSNETKKVMDKQVPNIISKLNDKIYDKTNKKTNSTNTIESQKGGGLPNINREDLRRSRRSTDRSTTPLYVNVKNNKDNIEIETLINNRNTVLKSYIDSTHKSHNKSPERKKNINNNKYEDHYEKSNKLEKYYLTKKGKEQIDRLATPKHKLNHEVEKKKESAHNNVHVKNEREQNFTVDRRNLIDSGKLRHKSVICEAKNVKNKDKENNRNSMFSNTNINGDVHANIIELEAPMKVKHISPLGMKDRKPKTNVDKLKKTKRNEYVINYDDKNGTVSSVCKVNTGTGTHRRRKVSMDSKESPVDYNKKDKVSNKIASLQQPDQQLITSKPKFKYRNEKTKINIQRTCQLL